MSRGAAPFGYMLPDVCYWRVLSPCVKPNHFFFGLIQVTGCSTLGRGISIGFISSFCVLVVPAPFVSFLAIMSVSEDVRQFVAFFWDGTGEFQAEFVISLAQCGGYLMADICNFHSVPILLFEEDAVFDGIISVLVGGTENGLPPSFRPYIAAQEKLYSESVRMVQLYRVIWMESWSGHTTIFILIKDLQQGGLGLSSGPGPQTSQWPLELTERQPRPSRGRYPTTGTSMSMA